ncbi:MAG: AAA family ATPase [Lachnospiraceae bacterium]|nr:AAA family ATPase [Lachnospiraceae bacterium]
MKEKIKKVLRFLFPEIQIIDEIINNGFFVREKNIPNQTMPMDHRIVNGNQMMQQKVNPAMSSALPMANRGSNNVQREYTPTPYISADKVYNKFEGLETEFRSRWIGMQEDIVSICQAFKRPFVMGYDGFRPKNSILMIGTESRGKVNAAAVMCWILNQRNILRYPSIFRIDLSGYKENPDNTLFLSDLYKALNGQTELVVFENIEQIRFDDINIISRLISDGVYQLSKRYMPQNGMLVEATGMLSTSVVSELKANGKYFVFTSCAGEAQIADVLGQEFMRKMGDIIHLNAFGQNELREIVGKLVSDLVLRVRQQLQMRLIPKTTFFNHVYGQYNAAAGIKALQVYLEENIYKPLAEYRLQRPTREEEVYLDYENGYVIEIREQKFRLDTLIKRYDTIGVEQVKKELSEVIGLSSVKEYVLSLENNLKVQQLRESQGLKIADISMHMIFTGNPGTGKTTIARLVSRYLKAIGVLSSGHLREVSRSDLIGQYVGQTAVLVSQAIKSAIGGVLFIDEAYSICRDKQDAFGLEAIDALVKGMEDNRNNLVVILAGYADEMDNFIKMNPGLKSRFPNKIFFEDYTPDEMYQIAKITAKGKGYVIAEECRDSLLEKFEKSQIKGRNDGGNGRLVRNLIEAAILKQSQRIAQENNQNLELLTAEDFGFDDKEEFDLEKEMSHIIGLNEVKEFVRTQYNVLLAREKRKKADLQVDTTQSLNMIFSGNPGTGKTTMARIVAGMFHSMGLLKTGHLVETGKGDLVGEYVGHTAKRTEEVFKSALGGVLFIDEAYAITNDGSGFGQECVDTLVKLIEDYRGEIVVILAGYTKEMRNFMKANSGLESRFPLQIEFPDYTVEELFEIGKEMITKKGFMLSDEATLIFKEEIGILKRHSDSSSGNGRMVRNFLEEIIRRQSNRIAVSDVSNEDMILIIPEDIVSDIQQANTYDLEKDLEKVIGLEAVKKYIRSLNAWLKVREERKKQGLKINDTQTLHMIFMGNPGTGKTMMARIMANVFANMGVIRTNKLIETDRAGLVAGYVGQTAIKTKEVIESALDGVLFIDEAYSLAQGGNHDFGKESIDTLVKMMDDNRDRLVVILAGYNDDMQKFLNQNVGLESRFPNIITFEDYTTEELLVIATQMYSDQGYILNAEARELLGQILEKEKMQPQFGNGRFVRNVFEKSLHAQALRLSTGKQLSKNDLMTITEDDIREVI